MIELQREISQIRSERGFVMDPIKILVLLTEEVGEMASELKRLWSKNYGAFESHPARRRSSRHVCAIDRPGQRVRYRYRKGGPEEIY